MCSVNDCRFDNNDEEITKSKDKNLINATLCRKCKCENIDVLLIGQSGYCKDCFLNVTNHKFRAALGKSKIIRHGDLVLVHHSGDLNSTVLLHLIKTGMNKSTHKKLIFKTIVLYIDDSTLGKTNEERDNLQHKIVEETRAFGFDGYAVSMDQVFNEKDILDIKPLGEKINYENDNQLHSILSNLSDNTSRIDLVNQLRRRLLLLAAQKLNCNKIFVADSTVDIAVKVLGDLCLGRGAQLSLQANFCDARNINIKILKPMRDFTQQELIYYSEYYKIDSIKPAEQSQPATSIQILAHNFATELESQFSGTMSTIYRTADKINSKVNMQQNIEDNCVLCDTRLDFPSADNGVTVMRAIEVSKLVSSKCISDNSSNEKNRESSCFSLDNEEYNECSCKNDIQKQITVENILKYLCYSCRRIFQNSKILCNLPSPLLFAVKQRMSLKSMKEQVSDFLL